ncbi:T1SS-143 repeat domain-containing protein, partial [Vibrio sp. LaRot3]|uniref:T1SS-143 repeat domain-containing protein n=1 Tax=Vibrio sp. LaRot3 TaxID=2998829 RepID=UPI0022CDBDEA
IDDVPVIDTVEALSVDEDDLVGGTNQGGDPLFDTGSFGTTQGADQVVEYKIDPATNPVAGLESQGVAITLGAPTTDSDNNHTYVAKSGSVEVFILTLNADGSYRFDLKAPIDHATGEDSKDLTFKVLAEDFDGDTSSIDLLVTLTDDAPVLSGFTGQTNIDEDDIIGLGSSVGGDNPISGNFDIAEGADGIKSYQLTNGPTALSGIESEGEAVVWANSGNPTTVTTAAGTT